MPKPFDATLKDLAVIAPDRFLAGVDAPPTLPVRLLNVDLSTVTAATDIVFGLGEPLQEVLHMDAQAGPDAGKHLDVLAYNGLLYRQYRVPVHSILLLLRPRAQHPEQTGNIQYAARPAQGRMNFSYEIIRLWERPAEALLAGGPSTIPLAALGQLPPGMSEEQSVRWLANQMAERLRSQCAPTLVNRLLTAGSILSGLRFERQMVCSIFQGVFPMRESEVVQGFLEEGRVDQAHRWLIRQGRKKLGEPDDAARSALTVITDLDRLDRLSDRLEEVSTWQELLQTP